MEERTLFYALGASILVHGLFLAYGGMPRGATPETPRLLEARLLREVPQPKLPEPPKPSPPSRPHPSVPPVQPHPVHARTPVETPPVAAPRAVLRESPVERPAPAVLTAPAASSAPAVAVASGPAAPQPVAAPSTAATSHASAAPAYSPPSFGAAYLHNPKPGYPMMARRRGLEGTVRLDVRVSTDGTPVAVKVRESSGHETLDEAAMTAVWHWRFVPAKRGGEAIEDSVVVPVRFRLAAEDAG